MQLFIISVSFFLLLFSLFHCMIHSRPVVLACVRFWQSGSIRYKGKAKMQYRPFKCLYTKYHGFLCLVLAFLVFCIVPLHILKIKYIFCAVFLVVSDSMVTNSYNSPCKQEGKGNNSQNGNDHARKTGRNDRREGRKRQIGRN